MPKKKQLLLVNLKIILNFYFFLKNSNLINNSLKLKFIKMQLIDIYFKYFYTNIIFLKKKELIIDFLNKRHFSQIINTYNEEQTKDFILNLFFY